MNKDIYEEYEKFIQSGDIITGQGWLDMKKIFERMSVEEKRELSKRKPKLYKELTNKNRWREYNI